MLVKIVDASQHFTDEVWIDPRNIASVQVRCGDPEKTGCAPGLTISFVGGHSLWQCFDTVAEARDAFAKIQRALEAAR